MGWSMPEQVAQERLQILEATPEFRTDPLTRDAASKLRALITNHPVDPELTIRSSLYWRDLRKHPCPFSLQQQYRRPPGFNGAGLYTSISGQIENEERAIDDAIRTVWASLYLQRAYDSGDITASMNPGGDGDSHSSCFSIGESQWSGDPRNILEFIAIRITSMFKSARPVLQSSPRRDDGTNRPDRVRDPNFTVLARSSLTRGEPID